MANWSRLRFLFVLGLCLALFLTIALPDVVSWRDVREVRSDVLAVYTASAKAGEEVIIYRAESEDWQGQAGHVKEKFEELIRIARNEGLMDEGALPIRAGVGQYWIVGGAAEAKLNVIVFAKRVLRHDGIYLDTTITHEFSNFIKKKEGDMGDGHGTEWQRICDALLADSGVSGGCPKYIEWKSFFWQQFLKGLSAFLFCIEPRLLDILCEYCIIFNY